MNYTNNWSMSAERQVSAPSLFDLIELEAKVVTA